MKFKNYIETESGIKDTSTSPGTAGQVLSSTVTGTSWIDPDTLEAAASKLVVISCKNVSGAPILKGTPVYQSGTVGATDIIEVEPADATISTGYLPAIGILQTTLNNNGFGNVVIIGEFLNYSTADIPTDRPGGDPFTGDTVYLAAGGGLTCIRPTGAGNAIQNMGLIGKVSGGNSGSITVASIMRANDVPNLPEGRIWIGDGNTIVSDTVYVDDPNSSLIVNGTTLQTTEALSVIGAGYFSDKVSIGTAASTVPGNNSYTLNLLDLNSAIAFGDNSQTTQNVIVGEYGSTDTDQLWLHGKNGTIFSHDGDVNEAISIAGVIDNVGNFGIGTTTPYFKLDVANGGIGVPRDSTGITFVNFQTVGSSIKSNTSSDLIFNTRLGSTPYTESERMRILNNGNVGIGTTAPASKLQVEDDSPTLILNHNGQASASQCEISARISGYATPPIGTINWNTGYAGNNSTWSYYNQSTSTNNFLKLDQTDGFIVSLSGSEKMRVNQAGNVGIGVTAPTTGFKLHVQGSIRTSRTGSLDGSINIKNDITGQLNAGYSFVGAGDLVVGGSGTSSQMPAVITLINLDSSINANQDLGVIQFGGKDDSTNGYCNAQIIGTAKQAAGSGSSGGGHLRFLTATASTSDTPNERMRITDVGNVGIGVTSPIYELDVNGDIRARGSGTGNIYSGTYGARLSNYYSYLTTNAEFRVGYASGTYATCRASAFTVTSDYRLKEKIVPLTDSLDRLRQLNVYKFNWIDKPNEKPVDGFIAHEVAGVIPEAVVGVKDEIGPDGKPEYQGLDLAKIVPLLTAALQQATKKIENLEERINLIENK